MEELKEKFKDLSGSNLEKLKELHSEVFSRVVVIGGILELRGSASINRGGMRTIISFSRAHSHSDSRVAI